MPPTLSTLYIISEVPNQWAIAAGELQQTGFLQVDFSSDVLYKHRQCTRIRTGSSPNLMPRSGAPLSRTS